MAWYELPLIAFAAYIAGSIPLGQVLTSVLLSTSSSFGSRSTAFIRVASNISKGCAVVSLGHFAGLVGAEIAAVFVVLGHVYPVHCQFRGGNGTATLLGALIALHPMVGFVALLSWLFVYYVCRYAGLSAVVSAVMTPLISQLLDFKVGLPLLLSLAALVIWRNRRSLERLAHRTENSVTWDRSSQTERSSQIRTLNLVSVESSQARYS